MKTAATILISALACISSAEVPQFVDLEAQWTPRPPAERIETYWIFRRVPTSPVQTVALVTTNTSSVVISNVNTLIAYEWSIAASNSLGIGALSEIKLTPANPGPVKTGKFTQIRMKVPLGCIIERSPDMGDWSERWLIYPIGTDMVYFTHRLKPDEPLQFWRWRDLKRAIAPAPFQR